MGIAIALNIAEMENRAVLDGTTVSADGVSAQALMKHKAVRLTYRLAGGNEYWGVQMTDWDDAPVLSDRNFGRRIGGRRYERYYNGPHLHMVVLRTDGATYWVVNTLLDRLSNETMIAIAKGLRPLVKVRKSL